jgi:hypothetical protein
MNGKPGRTRARIISANKAKRAAEMYAEGKTWKDIADELGVRSQAGVRQLVERYIEKLPRVSVGTVREVLLERLTRAQERALKLVDDRDKMVALRAADVVGRTSERIAKLHGLERETVQLAMTAAPSELPNLDALLPDELLLLHSLHLRKSDQATPEQLVEAARAFVANADAMRLASTPAIALLPEVTPSTVTELLTKRPDDDDRDEPIELR